MKKYIVTAVIFYFSANTYSQNVGIGTTTPRFPLSFDAVNGAKISLYDDGNPGQLHFGLGIFSNQLLQIHSATASDDIAFGTGNSSFFIERMRIKGNGKVGIGISSPSAILHVADSSVVFTAPAILPASPGNTPVSGPGNRMMWYADKAAFRAGNIINTSWDKDNIGNVSFAVGTNTHASGIASFAAGNFSYAFGDASVAMGFSVQARAKGAASFGIYSDITDTPNPSVEASTDRIFQIGNGPGNLSRSNALTILRNGNTGIGVLIPVARLHVSDSNVVFTGPETVPLSTSFNPPVQGAGSRMMWYPEKAAFRVGAVNGGQSTFWDKDSIGRFSFASGYGTKASGNYSTAMGDFNTASGFRSTAIGYSNIASANSSTAMGNGATASGDNCVAIGDGAVASAPGGISVAIGRQPRAQGNYSVAIGNNAVATAGSSAAFGAFTLASGGVSTAMGNGSIASGDVSTAMGVYTIAKAAGATSMGSWNDDSDNPTGGPTDRIFQLGNGVFNARSNAITVLRNGNFGIGDNNPVTKLSVSGNGLINGSLTVGSLTGFPHTLDVFGNAQFRGTNYLSILNSFGTEDTYIRGGKSTSKVYINDIGGMGAVITASNVGIGNTNPVRPLSFPATLGEKILLYPGGAGEVGIGVYGNELRIHSDNPGASVSFGTQDNAGVFTQAGRFQLTGGYGLFVNGSIWANGTTYASDERFKENITAIESPLQKLQQINGVEYDMKAEVFAGKNFPTNRQIGLLAQNVEKVIPEAVNETDGYKGVDYAKLVPLLVESIKEQQKQIEELKRKISELQNQ